MSAPYPGSDMPQPALVNTRVAVVTGANKGIGLEIAVSRVKQRQQPDALCD